MLVTGGAGFVGSAVVDQLVDAGVEVTVLDNLDPAAHAAEPDYLNPAARYVWGDVRDASAWEHALADADAVCHQAGKVGLGVDFGDVTAYVDHNDAGLAVGLGVLHHRRFTGRFVLASSMVVYGEGRYRCAVHGSVPAPPRRVEALAAGHFEPRCPHCDADLQPEAITEDAPAEPRNVYAATKLHQEHLVAAFAREHDVHACWLRYHNVYGPRMPRDTPYAGVASIFRSALAAGRAPQVHEDGAQRRDFVHVSDVARANVLALTAAAPPAGPFNVASGAPRSVGQLAEALAHAMGARPGDEAWPVVTGRYRLGDVRHVFASARRAREVLGFDAAVALDDGVAAFATAPLRASVARSPAQANG